QKRCLSPATAPQRIEKAIAECQEEIKLAILQGKCSSELVPLHSLGEDKKLDV
ncbi:hypothetical protein Cfor_01285, partial [Coptotermes formosanus]